MNEEWNEKRLVEVEARANAALPGRWTANHAEHGAWDLTATLPGPSNGRCVLAQRFAWDHMADASKATGDFIAHAREDVPALVAEVRRLRGLLTKAIVFLDDTDDLEQAERASNLLAESGLPLELPEQKHYRDMSNEERLAVFDALVAEEKRRAGENVSRLRNSLAIGVRHSVHPFAYDLAREFMRRAAAACGDTLDSDGVWEPCRGELWLAQALASTTPDAPSGG